MKVSSAIVLILLLSMATGCATLISGTSQSINFTSNPSGALISAGGKQVRTPGNITLSKTMGSGPTITAELDGYRTQQFHVPGRFEPWFLGNLLLGGLIGMGVDMATGAVSPYEDSFHVELQPADGGYNPAPNSRTPRPVGDTRPVKQGMSPCGGCGGSVSMTAKSCPHCGVEFGD